MGLFGNIFKHNHDQVQLFYHTDVHCHILPGVDHGSQSVEQSLDMLREEINMGIPPCGVHLACDGVDLREHPPNADGRLRGAAASRA